MPEAIAAVLERLDGQPGRFAKFRELLGDARLREEYYDYVEEVARRKSARYAAALLDRADFYAGLVKREGDRLKGHGQLEAIRTLDESLPSIFEALDTALDRGDAEVLLTFATHIGRYLNIVSRCKEALAWYERLVDGAKETETVTSRFTRTWDTGMGSLTSTAIGRRRSYMKSA